MAEAAWGLGTHVQVDVPQVKRRIGPADAYAGGREIRSPYVVQCDGHWARRRQPAVTSIVGEQSARCTASAIATSTWRDPSKGSLPCAVRRLSTSIRSPACQGSRAVLASYTSLINSTTSAPIGSPLPKRVLNGSLSSP